MLYCAVVLFFVGQGIETGEKRLQDPKCKVGRHSKKAHKKSTYMTV